MDWQALRHVLAGRRLPAAIVDLDALEHNVRLTRARISATPATLRAATKSIRHVGLLRRILDLGGDQFVGLMCFSVEEAVALLGEGFDDLLIAYPTVVPAALAAAADAVEAGATLRFVVDAPEHLEALSRASRGADLRAVIELDVSYRLGGGVVHAGPRRSSVRSPEDAVALTARAAELPGVCVDGLLAYEGHIAGVPDRHPAGRAMSMGVAALKRLSRPDTRRLRQAAVDALRAAGHPLELVNGGGSGSLTSTPDDPSVTEVTAGSGFVMSHLFDRFDALAEHRPALFFALELCRMPDPGAGGYATLLGGGYVASGEAGADKLPIIHAPLDLSLVPMEGAGEVQTPVVIGRYAPALAIGDPVVLRHAKAGELAERFASYLLVRGGEVVAEEPTYRGQGWCFF